jgi:uncharacterized membrane protein YbhN (UPF0104 family)
VANLRKKGITFLKILFSFVLLYFVFTKIQFNEVWEILKGSHFEYLAAALFFFIVSKVLSAFRLNLYIHQIKIYLTQLSNIKLYLLGMFYNLFLPGGIGGDAYKGYVLKKKYDVKTKSVVSILVLDRLNGLLLIFVISCVLALFLDEDRLLPYKFLFGIAIVLSILVFWLFNKRFFSFVYPVFWKSLGLSALVQLTQLVSVLFILNALDVEGSTMAYLFIFLISSIVSVLPLTLGGIGSREVVFYYGALWLGLDENTSVSISMLFFLITAAVSLLGVTYHFKKPELEEMPT